MNDNIYFDTFCQRVCSWCVNHHRNCEPLHRCDWDESFHEALNLCLELEIIEDDPLHMFGTSEDDYNFEAQSLAYDQIDSRIQKLQHSLVHNVQENQSDYIRRFGYEL